MDCDVVLYKIMWNPDEIDSKKIFVLNVLIGKKKWFFFKLLYCLVTYIVTLYKKEKKTEVNNHRKTCYLYAPNSIYIHCRR